MTDHGDQRAGDTGCFGCAFWVALFIAFCIVLIKALAYLWVVL